MDLWRSVINLAMEDAKAHAVASERLAFLAGDVFDKHRDRKKTVFRTTDRILEHLQDELFELDAQVGQWVTLWTCVCQPPTFALQRVSTWELW